MYGGMYAVYAGVRGVRGVYAGVRGRTRVYMYAGCTWAYAGRNETHPYVSFCAAGVGHMFWASPDLGGCSATVEG